MRESLFWFNTAFVEMYDLVSDHQTMLLFSSPKVTKRATFRATFAASRVISCTSNLAYGSFYALSI